MNNQDDDRFDPPQIERRDLGTPVPSTRMGFFTTPLSRYGWPRWTVFLAALAGVVYILNPTLGVFELLPDNLPIVGNLDEGAAFVLIWFGLMEIFEGKRKPPLD